MWKREGSERFGASFHYSQITFSPPNKQVRVTGNNRTKGALVGLTGVVKKAVGLGGWHWLVSERAQSTQGEDVSFFVTWGIKIKNKSNGLSPNVMFLRQIL
jgi:hypothetical protein